MGSRSNSSSNSRYTSLYHRRSSNSNNSSSNNVKIIDYSKPSIIHSENNKTATNNEPKSSHRDKRKKDNDIDISSELSEITKLFLCIIIQ